MPRRKAITTSKKRVAGILRAERSKIERDTAARVRADLTRYVYVEPDRGYGDRRDVNLSEPPAQPFVRMMCSPDLRMPMLSPDDLRYMTTHIETVAFRAVRHGWNDGRGTTFHWWGWEVMR